jgi:hypothetical protein
LDAGKYLADSVQDDPETHSYNVQEMVDAFVEKAEEWQDCVQGGRQRRQRTAAEIGCSMVATGTYTCKYYKYAAYIASSAADHDYLLYNQSLDVLLPLLLLQVMTCFSSWARTSRTVMRAHGSATWTR